MNERKEQDSWKNESLKPDAGTTNTTDPQENMEGPVSSSMKEIGESFDTDETKEEADEEKERKM